MTRAEDLATEVERLCEVMHNAYEDAAIAEGWETQGVSRAPWAEVPDANRATMRAAVRALLADREGERGGAEVKQCGWCAEFGHTTDEHDRGALVEIQAERLKQITKGYTPEHDDEHTLSQIIGFGGLNWYPPHHTPHDAKSTRRAMVRLAACLVAGIEWLDRKRAEDQP